jgi:PAS domain S-box-containing protein
MYPKFSKNFQKPFSKRFVTHYLIRLFSFIVLFIGTTSLLAWYFPESNLQTYTDPLTALCLVILVSTILTKKPLKTISAATIVVICGFVMAEYILQKDLSVYTLAPLNSTKMSISSAIYFLCTSLAVLFSYNRYLSLSLLSSAVTISIVMAAGHLILPEQLDNAPNAIKMPLLEAGIFGLFTASFLLFTLRTKYVKHFDVWRVIPSFTAIIFTSITLLLWHHTRETNLATYVLIFGAIITLFVTSIFHLLAKLYGSTARILSENRKCLDLAVNIAELGTWDWDVPMKTIDTNQRWVSMLNYRSKNTKFTIDGWKKLIHPEDLEKTKPLFDLEHSSESKSVHVEFRMKRKPDDWCWISCRARVVGRDSEGLPNRIMGAHMDISNLKEAQAKIQQSEESFRNAMEYATIGMGLLDTDGKWLKVNQALCDIIGYSEKELVGHSFTDITHPKDKKGNWDYAQNLLDKKIKNYRIEKRYLHKDGHTVWVSLSVSLVRNSNDEPQYFISQIQDISEQKIAEEKIQTYLAELEHSNNELNDFCYIASHDLKEPLRAIHNYSQFLLEDYEKILDADGVKKLHRLIYLTERMEKLISDLLYYSRLGQAQYAKRKTSISDVVEDVKEMLHITFDQKDISVEIDGKLPTIECDTVKVTEVFRNLFTNAIKYNDKPKKTITVGCKKTLQRQGKKFKNVLFVKDNGIGIPEEFTEEVFRIFKRLHSVKEYGEGTGAGLTFVLKIIENHSGTIWIESEVGKGSTFYFTLAKAES